MKKTSLIKVLSISTLSALLTGLTLSFASNKIMKVKAEEIGDYGDAVRMPSMTFYGDTATQMGFCWTTTNITGSELQVLDKVTYDTYGSFEDASQYVKYFDGTIEASLIAGDGFIHRVHAKGLSPDTEYVYRFGDEELSQWCEQGTFKTSARSNRNFTFMHISDPQGDNELHYASYNQLLNDSSGQFDFEWIALTGDITDDSHFGKSVDLNEWEMALTDQWEVFKDYPVAAVSGNHDGALHAFHSRYNYDSPEGSDTSTGDYYSFDYQGVHFTCLNSNDTSNPKDPDTTGMGEEQLAWAEADLAKHQNDKFLIVMMHKGLFDSGGHSCNDDHSDYDIEKMRRQLAPLFTKYGVDLVLEGHDHLYSLSYPMVADSYVGQDEYYHIDEGYKYSYRDYGDLKHVYTFSNLEGTFYFNTGTASGQKYYAPVIGGSMEDTIFDTSNPNQKMFTMVDVLDDSILLRTYLCTSNEVSLYKTYAIAHDDEGTPSHEGGDHDTDFEIEGNYSFTYQFARYNHTAKVKMKSKKLVPAEADLAGKFVGTFSCDGGSGTSTCRLYRTGKVTMENELIIGEETITFATGGSWFMNEKKELVISIRDEKEVLVTYVAKTGSGQKSGCGGNIVTTSILISSLSGLLAVMLLLSKKKRNEQ